MRERGADKHGAGSRGLRVDGHIQNGESRRVERELDERRLSADRLVGDLKPIALRDSSRVLYIDDERALDRAGLLRVSGRADDEPGADARGVDVLVAHASLAGDTFRCRLQRIEFARRVWPDGYGRVVLPVAVSGWPDVAIVRPDRVKHRSRDRQVQER